MYDSEEVILKFHLLVSWWDLSAGKPKSDFEKSEVVLKEWQNMVWILMGVLPAMHLHKFQKMRREWFIILYKFLWFNGHVNGHQ